jgi:hypothetical protein
MLGGAWPLPAPWLRQSTLVCSVWWTVHCDTDKADERDDNVTLVNFL